MTVGEEKPGVDGFWTLLGILVSSHIAGRFHLDDSVGLVHVGSTGLLGVVVVAQSRPLLHQPEEARVLRVEVQSGCRLVVAGDVLAVDDGQVVLVVRAHCASSALLWEGQRD